MQDHLDHVNGGWSTKKTADLTCHDQLLRIERCAKLQNNIIEVFEEEYIMQLKQRVRLQCFIICFLTILLSFLVKHKSFAQSNLTEYLITSHGTYDLYKISANPEMSFYWPYYLTVPNSVLPERWNTLLVEPNNTGTTDDDLSVHDEATQRTAQSLSDFAGKLGVPLLVPSFPRPHTNWRIYTHALDRDTLTTSIVELRRTDLQLISMINDAIEKLSSIEVYVSEKVFMMGFSASGMFTNRFAALHPQRIKAASIGSPGGWPIAPVARWQGEVLRYHIGISDLKDLTGSAFDLTTYKSLPLYFYIGDQDTNDSVPLDDSYDQQDRDLGDHLFGTTPVGRWPKAKEIYDSVGCNSQFVLYPGVGHGYSAASTLSMNWLKFSAKQLAKGPNVIRKPGSHSWSSRNPFRMDCTQGDLLVLRQRQSKTLMGPCEVVKCLEEGDPSSHLFPVFAEPQTFSSQGSQGLAHGQVQTLGQTGTDLQSKLPEPVCSTYDPFLQGFEPTSFFFLDDLSINQVGMRLYDGIFGASPLARPCKCLD
jgi:dienelactone hydrolase